MARWGVHVEQADSQMWDETVNAETAEGAARNVARSLFANLPDGWAVWTSPVLTVTDRMTGQVWARLTVQLVDSPLGAA